MAATLLQWGEEHRIGVAALDFEHQALFKRISELDQELAEAQDVDRIEDLLGEIQARMSARISPLRSGSCGRKNTLGIRSTKGSTTASLMNSARWWRGRQPTPGLAARSCAKSFGIGLSAMV
jgi:hypothetical protein